MFSCHITTRISGAASKFWVSDNAADIKRVQADAQYALLILGVDIANSNIAVPHLSHLLTLFLSTLAIQIY